MIFQALLIMWALLLLFSSAFVMRKELWIARNKKTWLCSRRTLWKSLGRLDLDDRPEFADPDL